MNLADSTLPSHFTLWLVGLEITHILSHLCRPTDQPHIERQHRSQGDFVWKDQPFEHIGQLQQALDQQYQY